MLNAYLKVCAALRLRVVSMPIQYHGFLNALMDILTIEEDFMCVGELPRSLTKRLKTTVHAVLLLDSFWR